MSRTKRVISLMVRGKVKEVIAPMTAERGIRKNVRQGAKILDRVLPDWYTSSNIKLKSLKLEDACKCVYGQLTNAVRDKDVTFDKFHIDVVNKALNTDSYRTGDSACLVLEGLETADFGYVPGEENEERIAKYLGWNATDRDYRFYDMAGKIAYNILQDEWEKQIRSRREKVHK